MSVDNMSMMEIYPYGGILAYLKYHFIDGVMKQHVMFFDKTRVVYGKKKKAIAKGGKSDNETANMIRRFGIGEVRDELNKES